MTAVPAPRTLHAIVLALAMLAVLAASALAQPSPSPSPASSAPLDPAPAASAPGGGPSDLDAVPSSEDAAPPDGAWDVVAFDPWGEGLVEPASGRRLTVSLLDAGRLEGLTGCGDYFGTYRIDGDAITLAIVSKGPDPCAVEVNEEAVAFSVALDAVAGWQGTEGDGLELLDAEGTVRAVLERSSELGLDGAWDVERYWRANGKPARPRDDSPALLRFEADDRLSGTTGCRLFEGGFTSESDQLILAPIEVIGLPCAGGERRQERRLLRIFDQVVFWEREDDRLLLTDAGSEPLLELRAADPASSATGVDEAAEPGG